MCEETVSKKQCYSVVIEPKKPWGFKCIITTLFISTFLIKIDFVLTGFFSVFHGSQAITIAVGGNK